MTRDVPTRRRRTGMTLIELLVVVAILSLLSVIVIPAISGNQENRSTRLAVDQIRSMFSHARNEAMAEDRWAGVTLRPVAASSAGAIDLFRCASPPAYRGDTVPAKLVFTLATKMMSVPASSTGCINSIFSSGVSQYDLVTFDDRGPTYEIASVPSASGFQIAMRNAAAVDNAGQTAENTPWPPENVPMTFSIDRKPVISGSPLSLGQSRCVDLAWSGYGLASTFSTFPTGATVSVVLDGQGQVRKVFVNGARFSVNGPVFLLVGRADRAGAGYNAAGGPGAADDSVGANWQYPSSYWISIDPGTGQVRTAECAPVTGNDPEQSRVWVRRAMESQGL
jgi:prepilin-type N-terminal cleavage/methylation domain-containing protein